MALHVQSDILPPAGNCVEKVGIILSTGRTGTMALAHHFDASYDCVTAAHEPKPSRMLRVISGRAVAKGLPHPQLARQLRDARRQILSEIKTPVYLESNWYLYGFLDVLHEVFPGVHVIHVVRDPRTLIPSYINFGTFRFPKSVLVNCVPYWYVRPEQMQERQRRRWSQMSKIERLAFHWKTVNSHISRGQELLGDRYLCLRYEDVFAPDEPGVAQIADFLGLDRPATPVQGSGSKRMNASRRTDCPKWDQWTDRDRQGVLDICGDLMGQYGYLQ